MKKLEDMKVWRQKQEEIKKETEEKLSKTDLSDEMKENYLKSLSYLQKDQRIKGNYSDYDDVIGPKIKRQQKEKYQFDKQVFDFRLDDWEIVNVGKELDRWFKRYNSPNFGVVIKIPNNFHKKGGYEFDSFFKGQLITSKKFTRPIEERFWNSRSERKMLGTSYSQEFDHSTFGENQTHWFVGHIVPDSTFNHKLDKEVSNHSSHIRNTRKMWIDCKEIPCFTKTILESLDDWLIQFNTPEEEMVRKYHTETSFNDSTNTKVNEYIKTNLQYPPSYDELMNQFIDTRVS